MLCSILCILCSLFGFNLIINTKVTCSQQHGIIGVLVTLIRFLELEYCSVECNCVAVSSEIETFHPSGCSSNKELLPPSAQNGFRKFLKLTRLTRTFLLSKSWKSLSRNKQRYSTNTVLDKPSCKEDWDRTLSGRGLKQVSHLEKSVPTCWAACSGI